MAEDSTTTRWQDHDDHLLELLVEEFNIRGTRNTTEKGKLWAQVASIYNDQLRPVKGAFTALQLAKHLRNQKDAPARKAKKYAQSLAERTQRFQEKQDAQGSSTSVAIQAESTPTSGVSNMEETPQNYQVQV